MLSLLEPWCPWVQASAHAAAMRQVDPENERNLRLAGRSQRRLPPALLSTTTLYSGMVSGLTLQPVGGVFWVSARGFFVLSSAGYAVALSPNKFRPNGIDGLSTDGFAGGGAV